MLENGAQAQKFEQEQYEEFENSDTEEHAETPQSFDLQVSYFKWKIFQSKNTNKRLIQRF